MARETRVTEMIAPARPGDDECQSVIIRPLPKIVILWPLLMCALVCLLGMYLSPADARGWGRAFQTVLFLNLFIMAFDFNGVAAIALGAVAAVLVLAASLIEYQFYDYLPRLAGWLDRASPAANAWFYGLTAAGLLVIFAGVWLIYRHFNYWEVTHNELVHHVGVRDAVRSYPTQRLRMQKEIPDVFEFWLLGSGRLVLYPDGVPEAIVLENVRHINRVEAQIQALLQVIRVEDTTPVRAG